MCLVQAHVHTRQMGLCDKAGCGRLTFWSFGSKELLDLGVSPGRKNGCSEFSEPSLSEQLIKFHSF